MVLPGRALPVKWGTGMCGPEDPLFMPSSPFARPPFQYFSVRKTLLSPSNHKFQEILSSRAAELAKSSVPKPLIGPKFSSHGYIFKEIQFTRVLKIGSGLFTSPSVWHFGLQTYAKLKVECLPPGVALLLSTVDTVQRLLSQITPNVVRLLMYFKRGVSTLNFCLNLNTFLTFRFRYGSVCLC